MTSLPTGLELKEMTPKFWDPKDKCKFLALDEGKLRVAYKGTGKYDTDAAAIRTDRPIPPMCGLFYFEIHIVNKGRDGHIGVGLSSPTTALNRLPGWDEHTYGYHADDGFLFKGVGGIEYGPTFTTGDTIGCLVNFRLNTVTYTKNGLSLGLAFKDILNEPLHPTVGLRTPGEIIEANFGQSAFLFDFNAELKREKEAMLKGSLSKNRGLVQTKLPAMILQYLIHYGYSKTAQIFASSMMQSPEQQSLVSITHRQQIISHIINGDFDLAINSIQEHHPEFLEKRKDIQFQLKYHRFIQMIQNDSPADTIQYGRDHFVYDDPQVMEHQDILEDVFSLLAYPNPEQSPVAYLFSISFREKLATTVNGAILEHCGQSRTSTLERCVTHSQVLQYTMITNGIPAASLCDTMHLLKNKKIATETKEEMDLSS